MAREHGEQESDAEEATEKKGKPAGSGRSNATRNVHLQTANPFDLIRLLAYSQSDARKALAELVQNSLDAGAKNIQLTRQRRRNEVVLSILDDGRGIFPDMERPDALQRIATNVGHSFKRNLSASQRQQQMLLGKYGIGLLGFWCVGQEMEMRTRVAGSDVWALRLVRDEPVAEVRPVKQSRIPFQGDTWTEIIIRDVHPGPARQLSGRKLGEYLGAELRGQLLTRATNLRMIDHLARSNSLKDFLVVPQKFDGRRLEEFDELEVPGFSDASLELYLLDAETDAAGKVSLSCGGTMVCEDIATVDTYEVDAAVWGWPRLQGVIEFGELSVAPSTRRGFTPSPSAEALFDALRSLEPALKELQSSEDTKRDDAQDTNVAKEIRNTFRPLARMLPQYDFFELKSPNRGKKSATTSPTGSATDGNDEASASDTATTANHSAVVGPVSEVVEAGDVPKPSPSLLEPGPLHQVVIVPKKSRLLPGASRTLSARVLDADGHEITEDLKFQWRVAEGVGFLEWDGPRATFSASHVVGDARIVVKVTQGKHSTEADCEVEIVTRLLGENPDARIPDPERVFDATGNWRSRVLNGRWEYNAAHPDYRSVADDAKARLRYFVHLFTKEIVLFNYGEPNDDRMLERMVEVLTHIKART